MNVEVDFVKVTRTDNGTSSRTVTLQMKGFGDTGSDATAETMDGVEIAQPLGLVSRPLLSATTEAIVLRFDDQSIAIVLTDKGGAVHTVEEGGTMLYGAKEPTATIYVRATGKIEITAKTGQDVVLNGGNTPVAKEGSQTAGHSHLQGSYVAGPYAVTGTSETTTDTINAGQGSPHILVP